MCAAAFPPSPVRQAFRRPAGAAPRGPPASRSRSPALLTGVGRVLPDEAPGQEPHRQRCGKEGSKQQVRGSLSISGSPRRRGAGVPSPPLYSTPPPYPICRPRCRPVRPTSPRSYRSQRCEPPGRSPSGVSARSGSYLRLPKAGGGWRG